MEIPEHLRELVDRLGKALVQALVSDEQCRYLARQIQESGYDVGLMLEATLALQRREEGPEDGSLPEGAEPEDGPPPPREDAAWSEEDRAFLRKFKISLD
jgi:hypothetical protein